MELFPNVKCAQNVLLLRSIRVYGKPRMLVGIAIAGRNGDCNVDVSDAVGSAQYHPPIFVTVLLQI